MARTEEVTEALEARLTEIKTWFDQKYSDDDLFFTLIYDEGTLSHRWGIQVHRCYYKPKDVYGILTRKIASDVYFYTSIMNTFVPKTKRAIQHAMEEGLWELI